PTVAGAARGDAGREERPEARGGALAAIILLGVLLAQGLHFIGESSQTSDEAAHLLAGYSYLSTGTFRMYRDEPPLIKEIAAFPLLLADLEVPSSSSGDRPGAFKLGRIFVHENRIPNGTILLLARLPILGLSLLLGWIVFRWGRRLFGARAALLGLALYVLDPNIVAHSCLVMTDLGATLFMFLSVYAFWCWSERPSPWRLVFTGLALGAALASKFTSFWLLPILGLLGAVLVVVGTPIPVRPWSDRSTPVTGDRPASRRLASLALAAVLVGIVAFLVVALSYGVRGLPAYLAGMDRGIQLSASGYTAYLMGHYSATGWWYYFLFAYLVKTPIGTLVIVALSMLAVLRGNRLRLKDEMFLWIPVLMVIGITCLWKVNIGLRHILPIYPFLYLAAGRIASSPPAGIPGKRSALLRAAVLFCLAWNAFEAASIAPHNLAYFNQFVGGPRNGHLYLLDSNLDWGQSSKALRRYMIAQNLPAIYCAFSSNSDPWYYGVRYQYVPGIGNLENARQRSDLVPDGLPREMLAVSAMALHFVHLGSGTLYDWLKGRPVAAMPGYSYLVYDISGDADAHARLAALYLESDLPEMADREARRALRIDSGSRGALAVLERLGTLPR
ncbi:MAG: phospholipid carrier-dependent glycosyltransferase, partial [Acidobacteria bacterium]|nr:phospholipid carrier-dependent glycosyltransferase [Acidobacteriota bacterium]